MLWWILGTLGALLLLTLLFPVPRRTLVTAFVVVRRGFPVLLRKIRLYPRSYTTAKAARLACEDLGPAYIKFGQMIASSPTAFPEHLVAEFGRCLDEVRPIPLPTVKRIIRKELGKNPGKLFKTFDPEPLASASIAQVHTAVLDDGTPVVVKVQRPGIRLRIEDDLRLLGFLARVAMKRNEELRRANLTAIIDDFEKTIREEMDFTLEANNIEEFNALLTEHDIIEKACAPVLHRDLSTERVLVMERFFGVRIDDKEGVDERVDDVVDMLRDTSEVFWTCVFLGGFFHGDIHAGNIMVLDDGRLGYIDFGIFGRFSVEHRVALADWVGAMVTGDGEQLARSIKAMGAVPEDVDWPAFVEDITESFLPLRALTVDKPEMLEEFFPKLRAMAAKHNASLPGSFVLILKQLTYFGRYVMLHDPSFNENLDPKSQMTFMKIFTKFNAWRQENGHTGPEAGVVEMRTSA
jgi:predicted unusual protein kinase regulating ubiquinone biosynthesis (AarF/ABC1/UbiB family)